MSDDLQEQYAQLKLDYFDAIDNFNRTTDELLEANKRIRELEQHILNTDKYGIPEMSVYKWHILLEALQKEGSEDSISLYNEILEGLKYG